MTPGYRSFIFTMVAVAAATVLYALLLSRDASAPEPVRQSKAERPLDQVVHGGGLALMETRPDRSATKSIAPQNSPDWATILRESNDYFEFAKVAAQAALAGDGKAAYRLAPLLAACKLISDDLMQAGGARRVDHGRLLYENHLTLYFPDLPDSVRKELLDQADKCARFADEDPFSELPRREGGYTTEYWRELAVAAGDPVARVEYALLELGQLEGRDSERRAIALTKMKAAIRYGIASDDSEAIFKIGLALADSRIGADPEQGVAWSVVACRRGYDCATNEFATAFSGCTHSDACAEKADWEYYLHQNLGDRVYARVFARAQALEYLLAHGEWAEIEESLELVRDESLRQPYASNPSF